MLQRNVTVSEILSKSNERITAGFSVKIVINCHGSTDKLYEDKVRVVIQSGSTTLRLIFPVSVSTLLKLLLLTMVSGAFNCIATESVALFKLLCRDYFPF